MTDTITLTGLVATIPKHFFTAAGVPVTTFRLASTQRRFDRAKNQWVDGETNWYSVSTFRQLATNAAQSVERSDRVILTGRVRLREWSNSEKSGMTVDVEADALGHDLSWGTAKWVRTSGASSTSVAPTLAADPTARAEEPTDDGDLVSAEAGAFPVGPDATPF